MQNTNGYTYSRTDGNTCLSAVNTKSVCCFVQGTRRNRGYERLDRARMESLQLPPPPHHYAGLDTQAPGVGLGQHGYIVVIPDPEDEHHSQVSLPVLSAAVRILTEMLK